MNNAHALAAIRTRLFDNCCQLEQAFDDYGPVLRHCLTICDDEGLSVDDRLQELAEYIHSSAASITTTVMDLGEESAFHENLGFAYDFAVHWLKGRPAPAGLYEAPARATVSLRASVVSVVAFIATMFFGLVPSPAAAQPAIQEEAAMETFRGQLVAPQMAHPEFAMDQQYLRLRDGNEIILIFPSGLSVPQSNTRVEITGNAETRSLGGAPGTRGSYSNTVVEVRSWRGLGLGASPGDSIGAEVQETDGLDVFTGRMTIARMQHPLVVDPQYYFRTADDAEWIAALADGVAEPPDETPIRVFGTTRIVDLGGAPGTRGSYRNTLVTIHRWEPRE